MASVEFTIRGLHPWTKKKMFAAGIEYLKWNMRDEIAKKVEKIKNDRTMAWRFVNGVNAVSKDFKLTVEALRTRMMGMDSMEIFEYQIEDLNESTIRLTVIVPQVLDVMENSGLPLASHFSTSKNLIRHIESEIKDNYTRDYDLKVIQDGAGKEA